MTAPDESVVVLSRALDQAGDVLAAVHADQLAQPTPCGDWDVAQLIGHLVNAPVRFLEMARGERTRLVGGAAAGHRQLGGRLPVQRRRPDPPLAPGRRRGGRRAGRLADRGDRRAHLGRRPRDRPVAAPAAGGGRARAGVHVRDADAGEPRGGVRAGGAGARRRPASTTVLRRSRGVPSGAAQTHLDPRAGSVGGRSVRRHAMTITEGWNTHPKQFWLRGEQPPEPVSFDADNGMWHVYGYPEAQHMLADPATFSSRHRSSDPRSRGVLRGKPHAARPAPAHEAAQARQPGVHAQSRRGARTPHQDDRHGIARRRRPGQDRPRRRLRLPATGDRDRRAARGAEQRPRPVPPVGRHDVLAIQRVLVARAHRDPGTRPRRVADPDEGDERVRRCPRGPPAPRAPRGPAHQARRGRGGRGPPHRPGSGQLRQPAADRRAHHHHDAGGQHRPVPGRTSRRHATGYRRTARWFRPRSRSRCAC